jgi:hypothetical protein
MSNIARISVKFILDQDFVSFMSLYFFKKETICTSPKMSGIPRGSNNSQLYFYSHKFRTDNMSSDEEKKALETISFWLGFLSIILIIIK